MNDSQDSPIAKRLIAAMEPYLKDTEFSVLAMRLDLKDKRRIADICLLVKKPTEYNSRHAHLFRLLGEPFAIAFANFLIYRQLYQTSKKLDATNQALIKEISDLLGNSIIGSSAQMKRLKNMISHVAPTETSVLLTGETGVGKEVVALTIQKNSQRNNKPFIKVNCGAIPDSLLDSELFGHEKGAFTGAMQKRKGRFELADGGTIFLDEIGEMPMELQVRLLRVLQHGTFERVGGTETISVDIRVIAATNRDLPELIEQGKFRQDLYYRLNIFQIDIPPLRERIEDIPLLVKHLLQKLCNKMGRHVPKVSQDSLECLYKYSWPGNIRELENMLERSIILHESGNLEFNICQHFYQGPQITNTDNDEPILTLDSLIIQHIKKVVSITKGKIQGKNGAAQILDVNPNTLRKKMQKYKIPYGRTFDK